MAKKKVVVSQDILRWLRHVSLMQRISGLVGGVSPYHFGDHPSTRWAVIRRLSAAGYLDVRDKKVFVTGKAFQEIVPEAVSKGSVFRCLASGSKREVAPLENFSDPCKKWLLENPESFSWYVYNSFSVGEFEGPLSLDEAVRRFRERRVREGSFLSFGISTEALRARVRDLERERRIDSFSSNHLSDGLRALGIADSALLNGKAYDPAELVRILEDRKQSCLDQIVSLNKQANAFESLHDKIIDYGEDRFLSDYNEWVLSVIDKV